MPPPDVALPGYTVELESEWVELLRGGVTFYYNIKSKISLWEKPRAYKPSVLFDLSFICPYFIDSSTSSLFVRFSNFQYLIPNSEKLGTSDWRKIYLNTYKSYFYNVKSREVQWHVPDEVKEVVQELKGIFIHFFLFICLEKRQQEKLKQKEDIDLVESVSKRKFEDDSDDDAKRAKVDNR
jgi:hypothetical protein